MTKVLITGAAGFIGSSVAERLLGSGRHEGVSVAGIDSLNDYYDVGLKHARLRLLQRHDGFAFTRCDIADHEALVAMFEAERPDVVIHLAAQAGVRYSLEHPFAYARSNLVGHLSVLEACRHAKPQPRLVYASSSSVYGGNEKVPFSEDDPVDRPVSLYAATKRADELMSASYAHLYGLEQVGLRFFTVYGPYGRPDMAYWTFTEKILNDEPIPVFNNGELMRDFTYIDDIVSGVVSCALDPLSLPSDRPHRVYNIGNNKPVKLMHFIEVLSDAIGKPATIDFKPMQAGDVHATYADISALARDHGYAPTTSIEEGLPRFVEWFKQYGSARAAA